jgi:uncharacterized protein YqeY
VELSTSHFAIDGQHESPGKQRHESAHAFDTTAKAIHNARVCTEERREMRILKQYDPVTLLQMMGGQGVSKSVRTEMSRESIGGINT